MVVVVARLLSRQVGDAGSSGEGARPSLSLVVFSARPVVDTVSPIAVWVRVQLIRHFKTCTTDIYLHIECEHVGLSIHAPVASAEVPKLSPPEEADSGGRPFH